MISLKRTASILLMGAALGGCFQPKLPASDLLAQGMAIVLADTGLYSELGISTLVGNHFSSATDTWTLLACYQFSAADESEGTNCVDSFSAYRLDNGNWVVAVTIEGIYRWRAFDFTQDSATTIDGAI